MAAITSQEYARLRQAILQHDFLHRILRRIEQLHRLAIHNKSNAPNWKELRTNAEDILIADIATRFGGDIDEVYFSLRRAEQSGRSWQHAIADHGSYVHNCYSTPAGLALCRQTVGAVRADPPAATV